MSPESHGNAIGIGFADLTTERLLAAIDPRSFHMNALTACFLRRSTLPIAFPSDQACLAAGLATCWQPNPQAIRLALIPNSLEVAELWVSPALVEEAHRHPYLEVAGAAQPFPWDAAGNLEQEKLFPRSLRGRRSVGVVKPLTNHER